MGLTWVISRLCPHHSADLGTPIGGPTGDPIVCVVQKCPQDLTNSNETLLIPYSESSLSILQYYVSDLRLALHFTFFIGRIKAQRWGGKEGLTMRG